MHELDVQPRKKVGIIGLIIGVILVALDPTVTIIYACMNSLLKDIGAKHTLYWIPGPLAYTGLAIVIISIAVIIYPIIRHILGYGSVR